MRLLEIRLGYSRRHKFILYEIDMCVCSLWFVSCTFAKCGSIMWHMYFPLQNQTFKEDAKQLFQMKTIISSITTPGVYTRALMFLCSKTSHKWLLIFHFHWRKKTCYSAKVTIDWHQEEKHITDNFPRREFSDFLLFPAFTVRCIYSWFSS